VVGTGLQHFGANHSPIQNGATNMMGELRKICHDSLGGCIKTELGDLSGKPQL